MKKTRQRQLWKDRVGLPFSWLLNTWVSSTQNPRRLHADIPNILTSSGLAYRGGLSSGEVRQEPRTIGCPKLVLVLYSVSFLRTFPDVDHLSREGAVGDKLLL
jgi:hypothetical protein